MRTSRKWVKSIMAVLCLMVVSTGVMAAQAFDVSGTAWDVSGKARIAILRIGSQQMDATLHVAFGPNEGEGLAANEWKMTDDDDVTFGGTYQLDKRGWPVLSTDEDELADYISIGVINALEEEYPEIEIQDVRLPKYVATARVTSNKKGDTLNFKLNIKAEVDVKASNKEFTVVVTLVFNGKETHAAELPSEQQTGSAWQIAAKSNFKAAGLPKITDTSFYKLILGPNTDWQLGNNEFVVIADDDGEDIYLEGTYSQNNKKITFYGLEDVFEQTVIDYATEALDIADDISWFSDVVVENVIKYSVTGMMNPGKMIRINVNIQCIGSAIVDGEYGSARCIFTESGIGAPTEAGVPEIPGE